MPAFGEYEGGCKGRQDTCIVDIAVLNANAVEAFPRSSLSSAWSAAAAAGSFRAFECAPGALAC